jgi:PAS domain S-box-containing protein
MTHDNDSATKRPTVLLAEDSTVQRFAISSLLEKHGYDVLEAGDGTEALRHLEMAVHAPVAVLADIGMPRLNGINLCRQLKNNPKTRDIPVIVLTMLDDDRNHIRAVEAGADEFLGKPVEEHQLMSRLKAVLASNKAEVAQEADWYRDVFEVLPDGIAVTDEQLRFLEANPAATRLLGYSREELRELDGRTLVLQPAYWLDTQRERLKASGKWDGRLAMRHRMGTKLELDASVRPIGPRERALYVWLLRAGS